MEQVWSGRQYLTLLFRRGHVEAGVPAYSRDLRADPALQPQPCPGLDYDVANRLACFDALMRCSDVAQGEYPGDARLEHTSLQQSYNCARCGVEDAARELQ